MKSVNLIISIFLMSFMLSCGSSKKYMPQEVQVQQAEPEEDEWVEVEVEEKVTCPACDGEQYITSICNSCAGRRTKPQYHFYTLPQACPVCKGRGRLFCQKCDVTGYVKCPYCDDGTNQCLTCKGRGSLFVVDDFIRCPACGGCGREDCPLCEDGLMDCDCEDGMALCPNCLGSGCDGQETYTETQVEMVECERCNGTGYMRYECNSCEGEGWIIETKIVKKRKSEL